jgi:uncharacterized membrane protein (UPF0127 family)
VRLVAVHKVGESKPVATRVRVADGFWLRARGLLGHGPLEPGEGMLLGPCRAIHTVGMRSPIDVAFLDEENVIVATYHRLRPNRRTAWHGRAAWALELAPGTLEETGTGTGQQLRWEEHTI